MVAIDAVLDARSSGREITEAAPSLSRVLDEVIAASPHPDRWTTRSGDIWAYADRGTTMPIQGWKLHVSATPGSAEAVLRACARVLLKHDCSFKVARDLYQVAQLTDAHTPRANAGKVLTAYPGSDELAVRLAAELDDATRGLSGPRILSDRPFRPGSLVHYRYGAFTGVPHISHDGQPLTAMRGPTGLIVPDRREVGNPLPPWASQPFPMPFQERHADSPHQPGVLLDGRFAVQSAIRHAYRGGVFRAIDTVSGRSVIVKQARAHVGCGNDGLDVRARLAHEARVLAGLTDSGVTPEWFATFDQDGDLFIVEEDSGGCNLRSWVSDWTHNGTGRRTLDETLGILSQAARALRTLHAKGVVVRDFGPSNIVLTDSGRVVLIDLELAEGPGFRLNITARAGTPAYAAPEQVAGAAAHPSMDSYALGATILFALTGEDPLFWIESMSTPRDWLNYGTRQLDCPPAVAELAIALCNPDPAARPTVAAAAEILAGAVGSPGRPTGPRILRAALDDLQPLDSSTADAAIAVLVERLLADVTCGPARVARPSSFGESSLATNVQYGAAGILGTLVRAGTTLNDLRLLDRAAEVAGWLEKTLDRVPTSGPVGLYFGHAGPCWALADAGAALGNSAMTGRAVQRALTLSTSWRSPDVTHGLAGLGLTLVHLWQTTGTAEKVQLRSRIDEVAQSLLETSAIDETGIFWRTPHDVASTFAGSRYHGFAHGTAGIGLFLEHAALVTGNPRYRSAASASADAVVGAALRQHEIATWGASPEHPAPGMTYWCNGTSGVGTFLIQQAALRGNTRGRPHDDGTDLLAEAARSVLQTKWTHGISYCHGLAGNADFLLDLGEFVHQDYQLWASDLLRVMWNRRVVDSRGPGLTDEPDRIAADFGVGYSGPLSVLLRLRYGLARPWLPTVSP